MNGINRVFILGYLGSAPEEMKSKTGKVYVRLSLATHYNRKSESGERESSTTWHRVTVWCKNAERCRARLAVGTPLAVEGYISKYTYAKPDGTDGSGFSIVARDVHFVSGSKKNPESESLNFDKSTGEILEGAI